MAFYKYGFAFLAGTGFGAALTSLRRDNYPLHRRHCCHHHRHRHDHDDHHHRIADKLDNKEAAGDESYMKERNRGTMVKAKKASIKEKKAAAAVREEEAEEDDD